MKGGGQEVKAQCSADSICTPEDENDTWYPVCWDGGDGDWTDSNWTGLQGGDNYPGENGSEDYCVVIDTGSGDTVAIDEFIQVRSLFVGDNNLLKIKPGGDLQLSRAGAVGGSGVGGTGLTPSLDCDGEIWISSGTEGGSTSDDPARFALDGGDGGNGSPPCILNGRIVFYKESGAGTDPGVLTRTKCGRLVCDDGSPCDGYIENDSSNPARGIIDAAGLDTFSWSEDIVVRGDIELGAFINDQIFAPEDMGLLDASTAGKTINLITGPKKVMGTYKASGGTLVVGNPSSSGPTVEGAGIWDLDSGEIEFTSYVSAMALTGEFQISGGTLDIDADVETGDKCVITGSCTIDVASGKTLTSNGVRIGSGAGAVTVTRSGAGSFVAE